MLTWLQNSGIFGLGIIAAFLIILTMLCVFIVQKHSKKSFIIMLFISGMPFIFGLVGTAYGESRVNDIAERMKANGEEMPPEVAEEGLRVSKQATTYGTGATAILLLLCVIGIAISKPAPDDNSVAN